jgi:hypothetical protein
LIRSLTLASSGGYSLKGSAETIILRTKFDPTAQPTDAQPADIETKTKTLLLLIISTAVALLIHGYHPYSEDAEIYLPGVLKILNPRLFPANAQFFGEHAGHSLYPNLMAFSVRASHLPLVWVMFLWELLSIFMMLAASLRLASAFFGPGQAPNLPAKASANSAYARWGALALMSALLTLPLAGTNLYILDQFTNPRNLAAFSVLFAVSEVLQRKYGRAALWLAFGAAMHPFMAGFGILFCGWLLLIDQIHPRLLGFAAALPFGITLAPPPSAYHRVAWLQRSHYVLRWEWYEWLGVIAPVLLFWWLGKFARLHQMKNLELVSRAMVPFVVVAAVAAIALGLSVRFEALARLQPLRCMALCYMVLIVAGGGLLAQHLLQRHLWRWLALLLPLSLGMYFAQLQVFPSSAHIEWPWAQPVNHWAQAFEWIRSNTPTDALFAIDPTHMELPGEDENGFRARSERSMLADLTKDRGAASMFPPLSVDWEEQVDDQKNFQLFRKQDFDRLRQKYGVTRVVIQQSSSMARDSDGLACAYANSAVKVCQIE